MKFLNTNLPYPPEVISGACGMKQVGKSLYAYEQGYKLISEEGGEILYLDTEEPSDFMFTVEVEEDKEHGLEGHRAWKDVFSEKYKVEPIIHFEYLPDTVAIMDYFGVHGKVIITEADESEPKPLKEIKGETPEKRAEREEAAKKVAEEKQKGIKLEFKLIKVDTDNSPFIKTLKEHDIRYIIVDSVTVFNALTIGGRQNFNIRSQAEDMFFETLKTKVHNRMKETKKPIYIFTTNHLANNPTDPFTGKMDEKFLIEKGGKAVGHATKILFGMKRMMRPHGGREFVVMRYPNIAEFSVNLPFLITDGGFQLVDKKMLETIKEEQKAEAKAT
jgi:hypothetical protein